MKPMTITDLKQRVQEIRELAERDPERAHVAEDQLHRDALQQISEMLGSGMTSSNIAFDAPAIAAGALVTTKIDFPRWAG